jgi:citrate synthase
MGFPSEFFTVLFAIPRAAGWLVQWLEMVTDPEQKIARPRQVYLGSDERNYVPMNQRT